MNWFRDNRWLGTFLIGFGICLLASLFFLFSAKSGFEAATSQFNDATTERNRLEHLKPFPNEANFQQTKRDLVSYGEALNKLKEELKTQVLAMPALAPNEFQSHLRQAMNEAAEKARANKVKLPDNFQLGFDDYTASLPTTAAAPLLGQELAQIELLINILSDARIDAVTGLKRTRLPEEGAAPAATPAPGHKPGSALSAPRMLDRSTIELAFTSSPSGARRVLNQIASATQQFFIIRTLHVRNEQEKGPTRETGCGGSAAGWCGCWSTGRDANSRGSNQIYRRQRTCRSHRPNRHHQVHLLNDQIKDCANNILGSACASRATSGAAPEGIHGAA